MRNSTIIMCPIMASRFAALLIWAAVAASLAYWGLRWLAPATGVPHNAAAVTLDSGSRGDIRRLLAGPAQATDAPGDPSLASALAGRLQLLGVVAPQPGGSQGVALLAIDGKPPRAVRVGGSVDGDLILQSLTQRGAQIGPLDGPAAVSLDLPGLPPPATGALPPPTGVTQEPPPAMQPGTQSNAQPGIQSGMRRGGSRDMNRDINPTATHAPAMQAQLEGGPSGQSASPD